MQEMEASRIAYLFTPKALAALCSLLGQPPVHNTLPDLDDEELQAGLDWLEDAGHISFLGDRYGVGDSLAFLIHALAGRPARLALEAGAVSVRAYEHQALWILVDESISGRIRIMPLPSLREAASELVQRLAEDFPVELRIRRDGGEEGTLRLPSADQGLQLLEQAMARQ